MVTICVAGDRHIGTSPLVTEGADIAEQTGTMHDYGPPDGWEYNEEEAERIEREETARLYYTCQTCGGEFWDGGTSCTCWEEEEEHAPTLA